MSDWKQNLDSFLKTTERRKKQAAGFDMPEFIRSVVVPAYEEISKELTKHDREVTTRQTEASASITVLHGGEHEIMYRIQGRIFPNGIRPYAEIRCRERKGLRLITVESMIRSGGEEYSIEDVKRDEIINNFLENYMRRVKPLSE